MTLDQLFADAESQISAILGGATTLSDPANNWSDAFVQLIGVVLAGQHKIDNESIPNKWSNIDINTLSCECLDIFAAIIGESRRTNKNTKVSIFVTGADGTIIPANTAFLDNFSRTWLTESEIIISGGTGFTNAISSAFGEFYTDSAELYLQTPISGVTVATNGATIEYGYVTESCEQFRQRLLNSNTNSPETELGVIDKLNNEVDHVKFINNYPDCDNTGCVGKGFVVRGGDNNTIANIIRQCSPLNYMTLSGNTVVPFDNCEEVKFIRPCPVGIEIEYTGCEELTDDDFKTIICTSNESLYNKNFNSLDITSIRFRVVRSTPASLACGDPEEADDCGDTVSLISENCPCSSDECSDTTFSVCATLESWEYPTFISATYLGTDCD